MRRLLSSLAIALVLSSSAGLFAPAEQAHACTDHVCACRRAAPKPAAAEGACHGSGAALEGEALQSTCNHQRDEAGAGTTLPAALLPAPAPSGTALVSACVTLRPHAQPHTLRPAPEAPPPRTLSC